MTRSSPAGNVTRTLAANRLGTIKIAQFALGAAATLTVVGGVIPTAYATTGVLGIPLAFLIMGLFLVVFCNGYTAMSRRISNTGALYAYVAQGLGRIWGVGAAWVAWFSYNLFQVSAYGLFGLTAQQLVNPALGLHWAWWAYAVVGWLLIAVMGLWRVDLNGTVLAVLMAAEILVILLFDIGDLLHPAAGLITLDTLSPRSLLTSAAGAALVVAITGFVGFEGAAYYSEEARDRRRTVPAATYLCIGLIVFLYALSSWTMSVATGPTQIAVRAQSDGGELVFNLATATLGPLFGVVGHVLLLTSVFAAMLAFHNASARYLFALGREGVVPEVFGRVTARSCAPLWGSLSQTAVGLAVIVGYAIAGLDPLVQLFFWLGTVGGFGILTLLTVTAAAIIGYFVRNGGGDETRWHTLWAPGIALLALMAATTGAFLTFASLLGVDESSPLRWIFPCSFVVVAAAGVVRALILRNNRPDVYVRIGLGHATTASSPPAIDDDPLSIIESERGAP